MPRSFRVNISGGIDAVTDISLGDGRRVAYMENLDVRGGKAVPFKEPLISPNTSVPTGTIQVYAYRGRLFFSQFRRNYTAEYMDGRERVYWSQYGGNPMKFIGASSSSIGATVPLGTTRPLMPPSPSPGTYVAPQNIQATVTSGGQLPNNENVTFRLAYQTAYGVLPPSGIIQPSIDLANSQVNLTWTNPVLDIQVTGIQVFIGITGGDEKFYTTLLPSATSFTYSSTLTASGALASSYDQSVSYDYCSTYTRNVNGVQDESGPSSPSITVQASSSRLITIDPYSEGILNSPNLVVWTAPYQIRNASTLPGYGSSTPLTVSSIVQDSTGRILCTFSSNHYFYNGQRIFIKGLTPDPFGGQPVQIEVLAPSITNLAPAPMLNTCYLNVGSPFSSPGAGLTGVTAYAVASASITSMSYNPQAGTIVVGTSQPVTFAAEEVWFSGFQDTGWNNQMIPVLPNPANYYQFFVDGKAMPSDKSFTGCSASLAVNALIYGTGATGTMPIIGDILYFSGVSAGPTGPTVTGAFPVLATPVDAFLINNYLPGSTGYVGPSGPSGTGFGGTGSTGFQFIPFNDYLQFRNIYRQGGSETFQLCKQLPLNVLSFLDALPDQGLGVEIPTLFTQNDLDIVVEPAPYGIQGLIQHYGMGFAFNPASNRVVWTLQNNMDAWPPELYHDFDNRVLGLISFNQAVCVFCEDGVYRGEGTDPTTIQWFKTKAAPCRSGGSIQFLNNSVLYLSDQGIMAFDGQESAPLTDLRVPGNFWLANSSYLNGSAPGAYLVPPMQNAAYGRLLGEDTPSVLPPSLVPYLITRETQRQGIRSFVKYGRYFLYWGGDYPEFAAQTMICIDFAAPGAPIVVLGVKAQDAFVDELERVHMLLLTYGTGTSSTQLFTSAPGPTGVARPSQPTFTAMVTPIQATGSVQFLNGATAMGSSTLTGGVATYVPGFTLAGTYPISAVYGGDATNTGSTSNTIHQVIT